MNVRKRFTPSHYAEGIRSGNISLLSQAITLVESHKEEDRKLSAELLDLILPYTGKSLRIGITGVPGVGKSTFIESFGTLITEMGNKLAVLAIDPTSQRTRGSILGDKTRMEKLSVNSDAYIRPSAAGRALGGVGTSTREAMLLCEAAGFNIIIIETVGVGQSETIVREMVDFFLLLMLAGAGDELQGIKRGIMEMADALVINKADGENITAAKRAKSEYQTALHYLPKPVSSWTPQVLTCSALNNTGMANIWQLTQKYFDLIKNNSWLENNRRNQNLHWLHEKLDFLIRERYYSDQTFKSSLRELERLVAEGKISASSAAFELIINKAPGKNM